jgi:hypothetical protein
VLSHALKILDAEIRPMATDKVSHFKINNMLQNIKRVITASVAVVATVAVFSLSATDSSLGSLRANATELPPEEGGTKCVETTNCDCKSPSTGTIYNGYKLKNIGESLEFGS